jgi:hypothetical protein
MPYAQAGLPDQGNSRWRVARAVCLTALLWAALAAPATARPQPPLADLDLKVRPGDVKMPQSPALAEPLPATARPAAPDLVEEVDRVERGDLPYRLSGRAGDEGGILEDLLEDKTIPLFRVRMKPPF